MPEGTQERKPLEERAALAMAKALADRGVQAYTEGDDEMAVYLGDRALECFDRCKMLERADSLRERDFFREFLPLEVA